MNQSIYRVGFWSGILAFISTLLFFIFQLLQVLGFLHYLWDQFLIFGFSLFIVIPFLLAMLALHYTVSAGKKYWTHAALIFSVFYGIFVTANYVVQLATVIPMTLDGKAAEIRILEQTPHSLFWDFDAIGYICMGIATLCAVPAFEKKGFEKWTRLSFLLHAMVTPLIVFVYFYPVFSNQLLLLAIPWAITAPVALLMLALQFRRKIQIR